MHAEKTNKFAARLMTGLSLTALIIVISGYFQPPQPDEGAAAHMFQLAMVALVAVVLLFLATADWKQPSRCARRLAFAAACMVVAFSALFYLEHYFYLQR